MTDTAISATSVGDLVGLAGSFLRSLRAANRSVRTLDHYLEAVDQVIAFHSQRGMPTDAASVRREHVESFLVDLADQGRKPATLSNRFRALQQFFKYLVDEGEITTSPMVRMSRPRIPEEP